MTRLRIGELCKKLNKTRITIWNYMKNGKLRFHQDVERGNRYFLWDEVCEDLNIRKPVNFTRITIGYSRVSTIGQKQDLIYQNKLIEQYCSSNGYNFKIIEDIGSGLNYKRKGFIQLINMILHEEIDTIVISYKDRLCRFGYELVENLCNNTNTKIEIINNTETKSYEQELVDDIISILTVYSAKLYGSRSHKNKQIVEQNKSLWKNNQQ